jgi:hypothetical protein
MLLVHVFPRRWLVPYARIANHIVGMDWMGAYRCCPAIGLDAVVEPCTRMCYQGTVDVAEAHGILLVPVVGAL